MKNPTRPTDYFGANLAALLSKKIRVLYKGFNSRSFVNSVKACCSDKTLTQRVELIADNLKMYLPPVYQKVPPGKQ